MPNVGTVGVGNRDQRRGGVGNSLSGTKITRDSRYRPDPFPPRPHFPDPTNTARTLEKLPEQFIIDDDGTLRRVKILE